MFELVNKKRSELAKGKKKGFTLVEVIVVLVILAILAAILVPTMIGWIKKANEKIIVSEASTAQIALQTIVSENYNDLAGDVAAGKPAIVNNGKLTDEAIDQAAELGEIDNLSTKLGGTATVTDAKVSFTYTDGDYQVIVKNGKMGEPTPKKNN